MNGSATALGAPRMFPDRLLPSGWIADPGSGPVAARVFHRLLALVFLDAWISLGVQTRVLIGSRGLLPLAPWVDVLRANGVPWYEWPTLLRFADSDEAIRFGVVLGGALSIVALAGLAPRACAFANTILYLSYAVACRLFLSFQWDSLLLECGLFASLLPRDRRARVVHVLFRVLLFQLYWESGLAKWESPLHDWQDGSAMTFYYETAPIPGRLAWYAHHLPAGWHHLESRATLALELIVPFFIFGTRRMRWFAAGALTAFQAVNAATANYGYFCYLSTALHVFLFDDRDLRAAWLQVWRRVSPRNRRRLRAAVVRHRSRRIRAARPSRAVTFGLVAFGALWCVASGYDALTTFVRSESAQSRLDALFPVYNRIRGFRVTNSYHLFAAITRDRVEPEFQLFDGNDWVALDMHDKPGDPLRAPHTVAPHQPRVDFQLWFYGLSFTRGMPVYVRALLQRLCADPEAVQPLFITPVPTSRTAVRIAFWQYHFSSPEERAANGAWWDRSWIGATSAIPCDMASVRESNTDQR